MGGRNCKALRKQKRFQQHRTDVTWEFVLCESGIEHIRVLRGPIQIFDGTVPAGYRMHLSLGDKVYRKEIGWNRYKRKFAIGMFNRRPSVLYADGRRAFLT